MKQIYLVDDHPMLREGLQRLIEQHPGCRVCGESDTAGEALEEILRLSPDLVMTDLSLPDKNGLELIKDLQIQAPEIPILVFSMHDEMLYAERAVRSGAKGYLMKGARIDGLAEAIECILAGGIYLSDRVNNHLLRNLSGNRVLGKIGLKSLTDRELEVFEMIGIGRSSLQISDELQISQKTVDAHRANIRAKLAFPDSPALLREAVVWVELGTSE